MGVRWSPFGPLVTFTPAYGRSATSVTVSGILKSHFILLFIQLISSQQFMKDVALRTWACLCWSTTQYTAVCTVSIFYHCNTANKAVNRGDKRTRRVRDRVFVKFERSRRDCYRYRCQEKRLPAAEPAIQFSETPPRRERALDRCSRLETPPPLLCIW